MTSRFKTCRLLTGLAALALLVACDSQPERGAAHTAETAAPSAPARAAPDEDRDQDAELAAFFEAVFERKTAESPIAEAQLGRKTARYGEWDDVSDAAAVRENEETKRDLARLENEFDYDALSADSQISYDIFKYQQEQALRNFKFRNHIYVAHHLDGLATYVPVFLRNLHRVDSAADAEAYISRLEKAETLLDQLTARLADQTEAGIAAPSFSYAYTLGDTRKIIAGAPFDEEGENAVYQDFREKVGALDIPDTRKADLEERAKAALTGPFQRGYEKFLAEVQRAKDAAKGDDGVWAHPDGAAYYANRIRYYTTLNMTADEIHQVGLDEVARIKDEMRTIKEKVGFDGDLGEFFEFIRDDPNNYFPNTDAGREAFLTRQRGLVDGVYAVVDQYFNILPKAKLEVRRVEPFRENTAGIAFYNRPSADGSRPAIYYTNLKDMTAVQKYVHTAIAYHEGVPGHHFQLALQQEMTDLPSFRKYGGYGSFIEGWGLYAELLAKEMGFYKAPLEDMGRLQDEIWRAVRLVVDTGIHTKKWTRQQAIDYFLDNSPLSVGDATTEVERYIARPGQALSYKIGMLKIQELRAKAVRELGDNFELRDFHDVVLQNGAVPLPILERLVDQYIAEEKAE